MQVRKDGVWVWANRLISVSCILLHSFCFHPPAVLGYGSKTPTTFYTKIGGKTHKDLPTLPRMRKIAIFGGTFDPVHCGHVSIAQTAASQFALDRVIWVPDRASPHKRQPSGASFEQRRFMVELAIADRPDFILAPILPNPSGTSRAIDTLMYLHSSYPGDRWYWIIGTDALLTLPKWHRCGEIGGLCDWLVAPRRGGVEECENVPGEAREKIHLQTDAVCQRVVQQMAVLDVQIRPHVMSMPSIEISSSQIRRCCAESRDLGYLVPAVVKTYIAAHQLYRSSKTDALHS